MSAEERTFVLGRYHAKFATDEFETIAVPELNDLSLREPRVVPPASLAGFCTTDRYDRAAHTYGKSYPDYVRAMLGDYNCAPDYPRNEEEISAVMEWASSVGASMTPFGGGSSVCGGVEPHVDGIKHKAAVTLDLRNLSKVVEVDPVSRAASIEAGTYGPSLENQLKPHGLTLRHFPQSFEYSTLGGWIATRSGGHSYPHRRLRRKPACRDASWRAGDAPTSRIGCGAQSRPHVHRFGRNPGRDFPSLDAIAASSRFPLRRINSFPLVLRCRARCAGRRASWPLSIKLLHPGPAGGLQYRCGGWQLCHHGTRRTTRSSRPTVRSGSATQATVSAAITRASKPTLSVGSPQPTEHQRRPAVSQRSPSVMLGLGMSAKTLLFESFPARDPRRTREYATGCPARP